MLNEISIWMVAISIVCIICFILHVLVSAKQSNTPQKPLLELKPGDKFPVESEDGAKLLITKLCYYSGKMVTGRTEWHEHCDAKTGSHKRTGFVIVEEVTDLYKPL